MGPQEWLSRRNDGKELVSINNMRGFDQNPGEECYIVKYFIDNMHGVHVWSEVRDKKQLIT